MSPFDPKRTFGDGILLERTRPPRSISDEVDCCPRPRGRRPNETIGFHHARWGIAAVWPFGSRAQPPALPVIGFLHSASAEPNVNLVKAFCKGLFDLGSLHADPDDRCFEVYAA